MLNFSVKEEREALQWNASALENNNNNINIVPAVRYRGYVLPVIPSFPLMAAACNVSSRFLKIYVT